MIHLLEDDQEDHTFMTRSTLDYRFFNYHRITSEEKTGYIGIALYNH